MVGIFVVYIILPTTQPLRLKSSLNIRRTLIAIARPAQNPLTRTHRLNQSRCADSATCLRNALSTVFFVDGYGVFEFNLLLLLLIIRLILQLHFKIMRATSAIILLWWLHLLNSCPLMVLRIHARDVLLELCEVWLLLQGQLRPRFHPILKLLILFIPLAKVLIDDKLVIFVLFLQGHGWAADGFTMVRVAHGHLISLESEAGLVTYLILDHFISVQLWIVISQVRIVDRTILINIRSISLILQVLFDEVVYNFFVGGWFSLVKTHRKYSILTRLLFNIIFTTANKFTGLKLAPVHSLKITL